MSQCRKGHTVNDIDHLIEHKLEPIVVTVGHTTSQITAGTVRLRDKALKLVEILLNRAPRFIRPATERIGDRLKIAWNDIPPLRWTTYLALTFCLIPLAIFLCWSILTSVAILATAGIVIVIIEAPIRDEKLPTPDDVRKAVENLERIVLSANDYCDSIDKLSKASKAFSKSLKDYGNIKGMDATHVTCFQVTSQFYESCAEVQSKLNKSIQKEFEALQKLWDKYSKKVTKEEKAHNDYIDDLDRQLNKITADYDRRIKKDNNNKTSAESYESICRMVENQNNSFDDSKKKGGTSVTKINEILPSIGVFAQASQDDNEDGSGVSVCTIISKPAKEIAMITRKLSRRASHKVSQSIASISELQIAAMNYLSPDFSKPLSEDQEHLSSSKSSPPPQIPVLIPSDPINIQFNQPIPILPEETITSWNGRPKENGVKKSDRHISLPQNLDIISQISSPIPLTAKPRTPDLISKISIGIHEDDHPFFRDYDVNFSSNDNSEVINNSQDSPNPLQSSEKPQSDNENKRLTIITGNNFSSSNANNGVGGEDDRSTEETKPDSINDKPPNPAYSFDTRYLVCSFPVDLPVRTPPCSPSTSPRQSDMCYYNPNYVNSNNFDSERVEIERKIEPKKRERLQHIFSQSDGNTRQGEKYNDEPDEFVSKNDHQSEITCSSPSTISNEDADKQNGRLDNHNTKTSSPSPLSIKSDVAESERARTRAPYNLSPRRAYTDYPLPINTNKRAGPSVADLRERFSSSLNNEKEKIPTVPRSVPISRQGRVITLLSKFDAEGPNTRQSSRSSNHSRSDDYLFRDQDSRSSNHSRSDDYFFKDQDSRSCDYDYDNQHHEDDRDNDEYIDHVRDEHVLSSSPTKQEECDCHICQKVNSSLDPQDDSSTFGRRSFCENSSNI
ncbi:4398_t:CDS:2 [Acaulospora colombiana]|uniref:4398_t:CDS:1 n=1 Tax=Acaulospora colombiana TaxID=27376 RepID=A0ACA9M156_9GLOM|nr:4398_t:CDS:2 [Acaulospora colombiana]